MARAGSAPLFMKLVLGVLLSYFLLYRLVNRENWTYLSFQLPVRGPTSLGRQEFQLRHIYRDPSQRLLPDLERHDVSPDAALYATAQDGNPELLPRLFTNSKYVSIQRLIDRRPSVVEQIVEMSRLAKNIVSISSEAWTIDTVHGPNATDRETILAFARMSLNAYTLEPNTGDWDNKTANFTNPNPFGWEDNGLRGHVFASTNNNSTVVIAFKGTSLSLYDDNSTTSARDKTNDNLLFSCCCGQGGHFLWKQVCQCKTDVFTCSSSCLEDELTRPQYYYKLGLSIYASVLELYPNATVWVTGHSLGGSIAGLLASTYGLPAIAFEAPADAMPASRLKLPVPPSGFHDGIYHFGHTADPVYMGICNRLMSTCSLFGYAFESVCHQGWVCRYDTVEDKRWGVNIRTHQIKFVIDNVLLEYDSLPTCYQDDQCVDCFNWKYKDVPVTSTWTTDTETRTTRTGTCKTPGWWGCLDESTTTTTTSSTTGVTVTSTETCSSYGWFGECLDETPTTRPSSSSTSSITTTETCSKGYDWFGDCIDKAIRSQAVFATHTNQRVMTITRAP